MSFNISSLVLRFVTLGLILCSAAGATDESTIIRVATGMQGGGYYAIGKKMEKLAPAQGFTVVALETEGSWESLLKVRQGNADFALTQLNALVKYSHYFPDTSIVVVQQLYTEYLHIVMRDPFDIESFASLAGGLVFGILMGIMGMLPMIGKMVGLQSATVGLVVHMIISAVIGAEFSIVFGRFATRIGRSIAIGLAYGGLWWLLGPLTLMPLFMGMGFGVNWNLAAAVNMLPSLMGHAIFGVVLSVVYSVIEHKAAFGAAAPAARLSAVERNNP